MTRLDDVMEVLNRVEQRLAMHDAKVDESIRGIRDRDDRLLTIVDRLEDSSARIAVAVEKLSNGGGPKIQVPPIVWYLIGAMIGAQLIGPAAGEGLLRLFHLAP